MFGGFTLCSFSIAWMDGTYNSVIEMFTRNQLGHIQIHHQEYLDRPSLYRNIPDYKKVGAEVAATGHVEGWAPRLYSAGLASVGDKTAGVRIIGVDPVRETEVTRLDRKIEGPGFGSTELPSTLLGKGLAKRLHAEIGDSLVIVSQAADGSIANDLYPVTGIVDSGDEMADQMSLYLDLTVAQELLVLEGRVHEIAIVSDDFHHLYKQSDAIAAAIDDPSLDVEPWQEFARAFYDAMKADQQGNWISLVIITLLVSIGVLNTVLMNVLERTREYGLMRAVGTSPATVFGLVITEVVILAIFSVVVATMVSLAVNAWLSTTGIPMPVSIEYGGMTFHTMTTEVNTRSYTIPLLSVLVSAVLISVFPAIKASRTRPAVAMRTF
jgi:putative ABC transport system permease protein